jgi:neutral ceramidase
MFQAGVARTSLTPFWGVELTGWGYYIERRWRGIHDPLHATALAVDDGARQAIVIALDLMVIDAPFARLTRERVSAETGLNAGSILLTCSHSHNAPAAGGLLGVGECDPAYEDWASRQAATAAILAWGRREPAVARCGQDVLEGVSFNRTRPAGQVDAHLTTFRVDRRDGSPLAIAINFAAHPTVATTLRPWDVSRDTPGDVCDGLEAAFPGSVALYIQGACGDVNFLPEYCTPERCHEPALLLVEAAVRTLEGAAPMAGPTVATTSMTAVLPTRRWTRAELDHDRNEAERRIVGATVDIEGWRESIGRSMTNRPEDMVRRHGGDEHKAVRAMCRFHIEWTDAMLPNVATRPEVLETEVQAVRIGDLTIAANSSEFFAPFALDVRRRARVPALMFACYANGRIGYLPDAHDIDARSYAGYQSPKYCNQFPFTHESGPAMCDAMLRVIARCRDAGPAGAGCA